MGGPWANLVVILWFTGSLIGNEVLKELDRLCFTMPPASEQESSLLLLWPRHHFLLLCRTCLKPDKDLMTEPDYEFFLGKILICNFSHDLGQSSRALFRFVVNAD